MGVEVYTDLDAALDGADVVNVLHPAGRQMPGSSFAGIPQALASLGKAAACGEKGRAHFAQALRPGSGDYAGRRGRSPLRRAEQVSNGVAVRMALLYLMSEVTEMRLLMGRTLARPRKRFRRVLDVFGTERSRQSPGVGNGGGAGSRCVGMCRFQH